MPNTAHSLLVADWELIRDKIHAIFEDDDGSLNIATMCKRMAFGRPEFFFEVPPTDRCPSCADAIDGLMI
jgi:hypothetical protein